MAMTMGREIMCLPFRTSGNGNHGQARQTVRRVAVR